MEAWPAHCVVAAESLFWLSCCALLCWFLISLTPVSTSCFLCEHESKDRAVFPSSRSRAWPTQSPSLPCSACANVSLHRNEVRKRSCQRWTFTFRVKIINRWGEDNRWESMFSNIIVAVNHIVIPLTRNEKLRTSCAPSPSTLIFEKHCCKDIWPYPAF